MKENAIDFVKYVNKNFDFIAEAYFDMKEPWGDAVSLETIYDQWLKRTI